MNESSCVFEIIDQTVKAGENRLSVQELCKTAGVSRSGYYAWVKAAPRLKNRTGGISGLSSKPTKYAATRKVRRASI